MKLSLGSVLAGMLIVLPAIAQDDDREASLRAAVDGFARTTLEDGGGWRAYAGYLHDDFTRWSGGGQVTGKDTFVGSIREWWQAGMRLASTEHEVVSLSVSGSVGIVRLRKFETFRDASGAPAGSFTGLVFQTWVFGMPGWRLLSMSVIAEPDAD